MPKHTIHSSDVIRLVTTERYNVIPGNKSTCVEQFSKGFFWYDATNLNGATDKSEKRKKSFILNLIATAFFSFVTQKTFCVANALAKEKKSLFSIRSNGLE